jgi:hypothetical protein
VKLKRIAEARVEEYVDAVRGVRALETAERDEGKTLDRSAALREARGRVGDALRLLTGGQLGEAKRRLASGE